MLNFDFDRLRQLNDVESKSVDRLLRRFHVPQKLRWRIISRTSRDNARPPFQWNGGEQAGFTAGRPWLGVNHNCAKVNLAEERRDPDSIWSWYRDMLVLRKSSDVLRRGDFELLEAGKQVFAYRRVLEGESLAIVLNFSDKPAQYMVRGTLVRSNYPRRVFSGSLQPWEAVILEEEERKDDEHDESAGVRADPLQPPDAGAGDHGGLPGGSPGPDGGQPDAY